METVIRDNPAIKTKIKDDGLYFQDNSGSEHKIERVWFDECTTFTPEIMDIIKKGRWLNEKEIQEVERKKKHKNKFKKRFT